MFLAVYFPGRSYDPLGDPRARVLFGKPFLGVEGRLIAQGRLKVPGEGRMKAPARTYAARRGKLPGCRLFGGKSLRRHPIGNLYFGAMTKQMVPDSGIKVGRGRGHKYRHAPAGRRAEGPRCTRRSRNNR